MTDSSPGGATPEQLTGRFGGDPAIRFDAGGGGLTRVRIDHPEARGEAYLHGAHVTAYRPRGHRPVLFLSGASRFEPGAPIRGGVPICFPWFGPRAGEPDAPAHGLARTRAWSLTEARSEDAGAVLGFATRIEPFDVTYRVVMGRTLSLTLAVRNAGAEPAGFEAALHTYLAVGDARRVSVTGLEGLAYLDKLDGGARKIEGPEPIRLAGETDRVYLGARRDVTVADPVLGRVLTVASSRAGAVVLWNPWPGKAARMSDFGDAEWPGMLCVETAAVADHAVTLDPGGSHAVSAAVSASSPSA